MARSKKLPDGGVVLTSAADFISSFTDLNDEITHFDKVLIAQIEMEIRAYWRESIEISKRYRETKSNATDLRKMMEKTFIYYDPKLHKVTREGTTNFYIYWRKAKFGYFKSESKKIRRGDTVKPTKKATTTTVAIYDISKFELPVIADWQRDVIERFEAKFLVLRQVLKYSRHFSSALNVASTAFDFNASNSNTEKIEESDNLECSINALNLLAKRLEDNGNDPDNLIQSEIDLLFSASDNQLTTAGISPVIKRIYTGINHK